MNLKRPSGLGRGLGALIPPHAGGSFSSSLPNAKESLTDDSQSISSAQLQTDRTSSVYREVSVDAIVANPHQPRQHFDHTALEDLVRSIQERGIVEPLIVTERSDGLYELIAGERRLRAARIAGLMVVPVIVREATEQEKLELAIIENVQRHDLNPIEEAIAYKRLIEEFHLTQEDVSKRVGKSRPQVANTVRLLQLPSEIQQALLDRKISASNARTLLSLPSDAERMELFSAMLSQQFTVRETERRVSVPRTARIEDPNVQEFERALRETLAHRVDVKRSRDGGGEIRIYFQSDEDLHSLATKFRS